MEKTNNNNRQIDARTRPVCVHIQNIRVPPVYATQIPHVRVARYTARSAWKLSQEPDAFR